MHSSTTYTSQIRERMAKDPESVEGHHYPTIWH